MVFIGGFVLSLSYFGACFSYVLDQPRQSLDELRVEGKVVPRVHISSRCTQGQQGIIRVTARLVAELTELTRDMVKAPGGIEPLVRESFVFHFRSWDSSTRLTVRSRLKAISAGAAHPHSVPVRCGDDYRQCDRLLPAYVDDRESTIFLVSKYQS